MEESRSQTVTTKMCPANGSLLPWLHLVHPPAVVHGPRCHCTHPEPFFRGVDLLVPLNVRGNHLQAPIGQTSDLHGSFLLGVEGVDHDIVENRLGIRWRRRRRRRRRCRWPGRLTARWRQHHPFLTLLAIIGAARTGRRGPGPTAGGPWCFSEDEST